VTPKNPAWFVETMGLSVEADGFTRIGGRLFGHLLLAHEPLSLDEIAEQLEVSKASVSTDARRLLDKGVLERAAKAGDRRDYYQIAPDFFEQLMHYRVERWQKISALSAELRANNPKLPAAVRKRLDYMEDVFAFMTDSLDGALAEWRARRAKPAGRTARRTARRTSRAR
jgi:DNA-binding transcriptional regulator GbsR (MarR family)